PTASMSKTMTMYMVFDALKSGKIQLTTMCPVSEKAWRMGGSKMFVEVGKEVSIDDLIKGVIIQSGNDATVVLAECLAGSEDRFAADMTAKARELGMTGSNFMNASGWPDPDHYSTPRDLALLAWHIIKDFPEYYHYFSMTEYSFNGITQQNRDPLLTRVKGADGLKTGHTEEAGYGLIGSAQRNGRRVIMVISGLASMKDREAEGTRLMNWALDSFKLARLYKAGAEVGRAKVAYGTVKEVPLILTQNVDMVIPIRTTSTDIAASLEYKAPIIAPLKKGEQVGVMKVTVPEIGTKEYPIVVGDDLIAKGFMGRTFEKIIHAVSAPK
ncbi:MAG TPA: D-alanyl-D-alanine carboxypeptidase family protein, partial [Alphaproteobacteria bacterium]